MVLSTSIAPMHPDQRGSAHLCEWIADIFSEVITLHYSKNARLLW